MLSTTRGMMATSAVLGALVLFCACASSTSPTTNADAGGSDASADVAIVVAPAHCGFDSAFAAADSGMTSCSVGRYLLTCSASGDVSSGGTSSGGVTEICLSESPTHCTTGTSTTTGCTSGCAANEYAAACGGITKAGVVIVTPPSSCHSMGITPGGSSFLCCVCE